MSCDLKVTNESALLGKDFHPIISGAISTVNSKLSITKIYAEQTFKPFDIFVPGTAKKKNEQEKL